mmetsp:Transcript_60640/g.100246  ORF Transcript_60640/g.100246 Transcript_60640/m.100246 type:complete len:584 (+) Transcript_60640:162-1913(+)
MARCRNSKIREVVSTSRLHQQAPPTEDAPPRPTEGAPQEPAGEGALSAAPHQEALAESSPRTLSPESPTVKRHRMECENASQASGSSPASSALKRSKMSTGHLLAADFYHAEGTAKFNKGQYNEAIECYSQALHTIAENARALCDRAQAWVQLGQLDEALQDCEQAIDVEPANAKAHRCKAEVLLWMCNFAESVAAYDAGMQKCADPEGLAEGRQTAERAQQLIRQCQEEVQQQDPQTALSTLDTLVGEIPLLEKRVPVLRTRAEILNQVGAQLYSKGAYKEASEAYGTACGAYTETSAAAGDEHSLLKAIYCNRAASHKKQGLFKEALEDCVRSITLDPAFVMGHTRLAHILEDLQEYQQAIDTLQAIAEDQPANTVLQAEVERLDIIRTQNPVADYYKVMGLTPACTTKQVKTAYKKLALTWHPDKCVQEARGVCDKIFRTITSAYNTLGDDKERRAYDQTRGRKKAKGSAGQDPRRRAPSNSKPCTPSTGENAFEGKADAPSKPWKSRHQHHVPASQGFAFGCGPTSTRQYWGYNGPSGDSSARRSTTPTSTSAGRSTTPTASRRVAYTTPTRAHPSMYF